jgi:transposase
MERGMDLARRVYSRDLKVAAMREIDQGRTIAEVARQLELSPKLLERWRGEWAARGELAFPGIGRRGIATGLSELKRIAELGEGRSPLDVGGFRPLVREIGVDRGGVGRGSAEAGPFRGGGEGASHEEERCDAPGHDSIDYRCLETSLMAQRDSRGVA